MKCKKLILKAKRFESSIDGLYSLREDLKTDRTSNSFIKLDLSLVYTYTFVASYLEKACKSAGKSFNKTSQQFPLSIAFNSPLSITSVNVTDTYHAANHDDHENSNASFSYFCAHMILPFYDYGAPLC